MIGEKIAGNEARVVWLLGITAAITGIFVIGSIIGLAGMGFGLYCFFTDKGDKKQILMGMALSALGLILSGTGVFLLLTLTK